MIDALLPIWQPLNSACASPRLGPCDCFGFHDEVQVPAAAILTELPTGGNAAHAPFAFDDGFGLFTDHQHRTQGFFVSAVRLVSPKEHEPSFSLFMSAAVW